MRVGMTLPVMEPDLWAEGARTLEAALDDGEGSARAQVQRHLRHYINWLPVSLVDAMTPTTGFAGTVEELRDILRRFQDTGADEVPLIPTGTDVTQVERVAELLR
jgi:alkanesulfonate monooxygenase SsuD/methylene tetrahydromethanopterin reductase-like flavin-dependent oxidoreductase (luciferase family)